MKIVLVQLYSEEQSPTSAPYSIEVLAGHLVTTSPGWEVQLRTLDQADPAELERMLAALAQDPPDVLGVSIMQGTHDLGCALLDRVYAQFDAARHRPQVIVGNTLPTYKPELYLERYPNLLVVRGFGEVPLEGALGKFLAWSEAGSPAPGPDYSTTPGIAVRIDGRIHKTRVVWSLGYSVPTWVDPHKYFARVETSRGCHFDHCTFCTRPPREAGEPRWIRFPLEPVARTIEQLSERGITRFTFCDEDFIGNDPDFCFRLADRIERVPAPLSFSFSTRADNIIRLKDDEAANARRRELLIRLKEVGLSLLFVGCESFCDRQLKRYAKANTAEGNIRALQVLDEVGLAAEAGFIMFDPFATIDDVLENVANIEAHRLWTIMSQTLSRIDVQDSSPLHKWLSRTDLLGAYDPNQMTYAYRFEDPLIQQVADWCETWKQETDNAYRLARNAQRMALFDDFPNHVVEAAKELNFEFVREVARTAAADLGQVPAVIARLEGRRDAVIAAMMAAIQSPRVHADLGDRLRTEISGFLGVRDAAGQMAPLAT